MSLTLQTRQSLEQSASETQIVDNLVFQENALRVLEFLPVGVVVADLRGCIQYINAAYSKMFGYRLADVQNKRLQDFALSDHQQTIRDALELRSQGAASSYRYQLYRHDGTVADVELSGTPYCHTDGTILGKVAIVKDISEELALERATFEARRAINKQITDTLIQTKRSLEREKNSALEILEMLQDGFALVGLDGKFEYVNPAFAQICQLNPAFMLGLDANTFVHEEDLPEIRQRLADLASLPNVRYQHRVKQVGGNLITVKARASLRFDVAGTANGLLLMARDISHELESQAKMQQLEVELQSFTKNLKGGAGISGRLENIGGATGLIQMLKVSAIAGVVVLDDSQMYLLGGRIVGISHPKLSGIEAVRAMMQRQHGHFQFMPSIQSNTQDLDLDPTKIALELLVEQDKENAAPHQQVVLPNSAAANAFMNGVGGRQQFSAGLENGTVILTGRGFKIVVLQAQLEDFELRPRVAFLPATPPEAQGWEDQ